ncbi:MAG: hypothetical protein JNK38_15425 [Acidobacteria bacterium]|nr:hypothetical protein [Acidobacteriota bacterium]
MGKYTRTKISLLVLGVVLLATSGWLYFRRPQPVDIAAYVPESALGYLEINNLPQLVSNLTATRGWQQLAPVYGISDKLGYLTQAENFGWLAGLTGNDEAAVLANAQVAIVVTGLEARNEAVKPRFALVLVSTGNAKPLQALIEKRLPELANSLLGPTRLKMEEQAGKPVSVYQSVADTQKELISIQYDDAWILANHTESLRGCISAKLGRQASMANNFYRQQTRPAVGANAAAFGFVTAEGVKRLLRFGTYVASGGVVGKAALAGAVGEVFTEFSNRTCDGLAYGASFESGANGLEIVDRYLTLFKPELTDKLKTVIKPNSTEAAALGVIPAAAREVTIYNVAQPSQTLEELEKAISARVDVAQSFLLHQFVLGMREAAFGAKSSDLTNAAIGDEIASFNLTKEAQNRVWLIAARDRAKLSLLGENILTQFQDKKIANLNREMVSGFELLVSSEPTRGAAVFVGNFLALGQRDQLVQLIEAHRKGQTLKASSQFKLTSRPTGFAPSLSLTSIKDESNDLMIALARLTGLSVIPANVTALDQLPWAASATSITEQGLAVETRSPFGNLPFLVSLIAGSNQPQQSE